MKLSMKKAVSCMLAAVLIFGLSFLPSIGAKAAINEDDWFETNYPGSAWMRHSEFAVTITVAADAKTSTQAQEMKYSTVDKTAVGNYAGVPLKKGYTGDISWTYKGIDGYTIGAKSYWEQTTKSSNGTNSIPLYGYTTYSNNALTFRIHLDNYDGSRYWMLGLVAYNGTNRSRAGATVYDADVAKMDDCPWATSVPSRTAADEAAYQAGNSGQNTASNSTAVFSMYRLKNPTTGEHLYTASAAEATNVKKAGWIDETPAGGAWKAPAKSAAPVYRLYNPNKKTCNHLYSMNQTEMANLTKAGWKVEGVAYYSDTNKGVPVYREYNKKTGDHNYTTNLAEHNQLAAQGWTAEGVAWYGVK